MTYFQTIYDRWGKKPTKKSKKEWKSYCNKSKKKKTHPLKYDEYIKSKGWRVKSRRIKKERRYECFVCKSGNELTVHHSCYKNLGKEKESTLIVLCWECHQEVHNLMLNNKEVTLKNAHETYKKLQELTSYLD